MKKFIFQWTEELREKVEKDMVESGHVTIGSFIRMVLRKYPYSDKRWTDEDMKSFAREFAEREQPKMGVLQSQESQLKEAFINFKNKRA